MFPRIAFHFLCSVFPYSAVQMTPINCKPGVVLLEVCRTHIHSFLSFFKFQMMLSLLPSASFALNDKLWHRAGVYDVSLATEKLLLQSNWLNAQMYRKMSQI